MSLGAIVVGLYWGLVIAPPDAYQGEVQRIMYLHLPSILTAYLSYFLVFIGSCMYLWKREKRDDILAHSVELGVLSFRPDDPQLRSIAVYRDTLALVVNPRHKLARVPEVTIRELGSEMFVAHNVASPQRAKVHEAFRRHKTALRIEVELPSLDAVKRFVEMGNGVALVPGLTVQHELASGALVQVPVKELQMERKLRLVHRRHATLSHAALAFLDEVERYANTAGDPFTFQVERGPA